MHEQIVKKITGKDEVDDNSLQQTLDHPIEASLLPQSSQLLPTFSVTEWSNSFSQYLAKRVRRNPRDLRAHVQRTLLHLSKQDSEAIYAALIDLFLILGNRGLHLRKNLLTQATPFLKKEQVEFLMRCMERGLDTDTPLPSNTFSSLSKGLSGTTHIVSLKTTAHSHPDTAPIEQAMERLHQNDWLTAMVILENALDHDPGDDAVCCELLFLYKQQHAQEAFYRTYTRLIGRSVALPDLWCDTERFFRDSKHITN
ncbi:MAG: hypothetical protein P8179_10780 [Candidatus Thiodiazotropha sp.]|jgi:hypothetical protein